MSQNNNKPIVKALKQVLGFFCIDEHIEDKQPWCLHLAEEVAELVGTNTSPNHDDNVWDKDSKRFIKMFWNKFGISQRGIDIQTLVQKILKGNNKFTTKWNNGLYRYLSISNDNSPVGKLVNNKDYSFAKSSHDMSPENRNKILGLSYLVSAFRESVLWGYQPKKSLKILIIDDRLFEYKEDANTPTADELKHHLNKIIDICERLSIECYSLIKNTTLGCEIWENFKIARNKLVSNENSPDEKYIGKIKKGGKGLFTFTPVEIGIYQFDYILVDLWFVDTMSIGGLSLISELHHALQEKYRKEHLSFKFQIDKDKNSSKSLPDDTSDKPDNLKIPEILAYSKSADAETIQMAQRMGAAGYVMKNMPQSLVLEIVRAGPPLSIQEATIVDYLTVNNFPSIAKLPKQIVKDLFQKEIAMPDSRGNVKINPDIQWIRKIPKADLHVHFGTAIPLKWCYILSLISLNHWIDYWEQTGKSDYKSILLKLSNTLLEIYLTAIKNLRESERKNIPTSFRREYLHAFSKKYKISEIVLLKDAISYLVKQSEDKLSDKQISCLIDVIFGTIALEKKEWNKLYEEANKRLKDLQKFIEPNHKENREIHNLIFFRDCRHLIRTIKPLEIKFSFGLMGILKKMGSQKLSEKKCKEELSVLNSINYLIDELLKTKIDFEPLSEMLATDYVKNPYGLERYLGGCDLVGGSLLQFTDTLLLASMSIPEWAAGKKKVKDEKKTKDDTNNEDNVIHLELRTTPAGWLQPYDFKMQDSTIAGKLICVGLEFGIKILLDKPESVSANLLLSIKRDREKTQIGDLIRVAVDMRDEYKRYLELKNLSEVEGYMIPHMAGLDVAGIERNNLPADLKPYFREAFERCLLSTIHAGETESPRSVRDAIFMLSASRIGHGLSIEKDPELQKMVGDRGMCVELCPKSNQFTNGFTVFSLSKNEQTKGKQPEPNEYVYNNFRGKLLLSINTDNPTISHKARGLKSFAYPMSEEFIWLSGMINSEKNEDGRQRPLSRLEVLHLIYNSFTSMFAPEQVKKYIINLADDEVLKMLASEYLNID